LNRGKTKGVRRGKRGNGKDGGLFEIENTPMILPETLISIVSAKTSGGPHVGEEKYPQRFPLPSAPLRDGEGEVRKGETRKNTYTKSFRKRIPRNSRKTKTRGLGVKKTGGNRQTATKRGGP